MSNYLNEAVRDLISCSERGLSEKEKKLILESSVALHESVVTSESLDSIKAQIEFSKIVYKCFCQIINDDDVISDIVFCGRSERTWDEISQLLKSIYEIEMPPRAVCAMYSLYEIDKGFYLDSPLPS